MIVACLLTVSIVCQQTASASSTPDKDARFAQKVRAAVLELGVGQTSLVSVKLRDKTKLAGYISEIGDSSFVFPNYEHRVFTQARRWWDSGEEISSRQTSSCINWIVHTA